MNKVQLSIFIEDNYPISGTGRPRKPRYGIGVNDAHYMTTPIVNGAQLYDPAYRAWVSMLERGHSEQFLEKNPTYSDVTVCKEWHSFSAFRAWWLDNYREGFSLDKDLLIVGNREYSPWSCLYVPRWLNNFTTDCGALRGELPIGVCLCNQTGKYKSQCRSPITGKNRNLGLFATQAAAHDAWRRYKLELAAQLKPEMDSIDKRIYHNVVTIIGAAE